MTLGHGFDGLERIRDVGDYKIPFSSLFHIRSIRRIRDTGFQFPVAMGGVPRAEHSLAYVFAD